MPHHVQQNSNGLKDSIPPMLEARSYQQNNSTNATMVNGHFNVNPNNQHKYNILNEPAGNHSRYGGHSQSFQREDIPVVVARSYRELRGFPHDSTCSSNNQEPLPRRPPRDFAQHETFVKTSRPTNSINMMCTADEYHAEYYPYSNAKRIISHRQGERIPRIMSDPHFRHYQDGQPPSRRSSVTLPLTNQRGPGPHLESQGRDIANNFVAGAAQSAPVERVQASSFEPRREQPPHSPNQMNEALDEMNSSNHDSRAPQCPRPGDNNNVKDLQGAAENPSEKVNDCSETRLPPLKKREERLSKLSTGGEEKKETDESQEKELVNGALLALVSLAQGPAQAPSCAQKPTRKASTTSLASIRESETQTPPPHVETLSSNTITPSSSMATMNALSGQQPPSNTTNFTCIKDNLSSVSDDSNPRSDPSTANWRSRSTSLSEKSAEDYQPSRTLPPKHPLTLPHSSHDSKRGNPPPPFPLPSRSHIPVPRLDRDRLVNAVPGYTLTMRKDVELHYDRDNMYGTQPQQYVTTDGSCVHEARRPVRSGRPRFYSTPIEYSRQGHHEYDRINEYPPLSHRPHGLEMRGSFEDGRMGGLANDHLFGQRSRVAARDDCEERGHQYQIARQHFPEEVYYSPSTHYLPLHKRQSHGPPVFHPPSQSMPRSGHFIQHPPPAQGLSSQEVKIQFECPDSRGSRKESSGGPVSRVSSYEDYSPSPYQMSVYHNRLPDGHPQGQMGVKKTILRRKCAWKNYPELEKFLIENREEYLLHSAKNYTIEQKQYNNRLTERLLEVAAKHNYMFDPNDFNFVAVRDRIRCYYKSYVQSNKKRGVIVGYDAMGTKKKQKVEEDNSEKNTVQEAPKDEKTEESKKINEQGKIRNTDCDKKPEESYIAEK